MITRQALFTLHKYLDQFPVTALIGPRQVGKTTLAITLMEERPCLYLDLENYNDLAKLDDPLAFFSMHQDKLIILDEIQRKPELFAPLRGIIDARRRLNKKTSQFLILGSASVELLRQSSESLAGRIVYLEMTPFTLIEVMNSGYTSNQLWLRGGFPDSLIASNDMQSMIWRQMFIRSYIERDIPFFNPRLPSETLYRLWQMIAHQQGGLLNASQLALSLSVASPTVDRYIDLLVDLFLVRRLKPWSGNTKKRLVKSPKLYVRDSGILHALLNISTIDILFGHPVVGTSFEGYIIDNILSQLPLGMEAYFYRTARGAELDLYVIGAKTYAIEIKRSLQHNLSRGFHAACLELKPDYKFLIYDGVDTFTMQHDVIATNLTQFIQQLTKSGEIQ